MVLIYVHSAPPRFSFDVYSLDELRLSTFKPDGTFCTEAVFSLMSILPSRSANEMACTMCFINVAVTVFVVSTSTSMFLHLLVRTMCDNVGNQLTTVSICLMPVSSLRLPEVIPEVAFMFT